MISLVDVMIKSRNTLSTVFVWRYRQFGWSRLQRSGKPQIRWNLVTDEPALYQQNKTNPNPKSIEILCLE